MSYLQRQLPPVIHRDINPDNIVIDPDGTLHIIDFGAVKQTLQGDTITTMGTFGYMAPEQIMGQATPQSDCYSLGITFLVIANGITPDRFPLNAETGVVDLKKLLPQVPQSCRKAVELMIQPSLKKRIQRAADALKLLERTALSGDDTLLQAYLNGGHPSVVTSGKMVKGSVERILLPTRKMDPTPYLFGGLTAPLFGFLSDGVIFQWILIATGVLLLGKVIQGYFFSDNRLELRCSRREVVIYCDGVVEQIIPGNRIERICYREVKKGYELYFLLDDSSEISITEGEDLDLIKEIIDRVDGVFLF